MLDSASSRILEPVSLRVLYSNACSIAKKLLELEQLIADVDLLAVSESWLSSTHCDGSYRMGGLSICAISQESMVEVVSS